MTDSTSISSTAQSDDKELPIEHLPSFSDGRNKLMRNSVSSRRYTLSRTSSRRDSVASQSCIEMKTNPEHRHEVSLRVTLLGSSGAGKSCFALRFVRDSWVENWPPTIEDCYTKSLETGLGPEHGSRRAVSHFQMFDTSGDEEYTHLRPNWMSEKDGYLLVFSLASRTSLDTAKEYESLYDEHCQKLIQSYRELRDAHPMEEYDPPRLPFIFVVGTKKDVVDEDPVKRVITSQEGHRWAERIGAEYFETSAKTCEGVVPVFERMARICREPDELNPKKSLEDILDGTYLAKNVRSSLIKPASDPNSVADPDEYDDPHAAPASASTQRQSTSSFSGRKYSDENERRQRNWFCAMFCCCLCLRSRAQPNRYHVNFPAHQMLKEHDRASSSASNEEFLKDDHSHGSTPNPHRLGAISDDEDDDESVHASDISASMTEHIHINRRITDGSDQFLAV